MKKATEKKRGRPPSDDARRKPIHVRVSADEYEELVQAAKAASEAASKSAGFPITIEVATYVRDFVLSKLRSKQ